MSTATLNNPALEANQVMQPVNTDFESVRVLHPVTSAEIAQINARNQLLDSACSVGGAILMGCVAATVVTVAGWLVYNVVAEMSTWNLSDFANSIAGFRVS